MRNLITLAGLLLLVACGDDQPAKDTTTTEKDSAWSNEDKDRVMQHCKERLLPALANDLGQPVKMNPYCTCFLEKVQKQYADYEKFESDKLDDAHQLAVACAQKIYGH